MFRLLRLAARRAALVPVFVSLASGALASSAPPPSGPLPATLPPVFFALSVEPLLLSGCWNLQLSSSLHQPFDFQCRHTMTLFSEAAVVSDAAVCWVFSICGSTRTMPPMSGAHGSTVHDDLWPCPGLARTRYIGPASTASLACRAPGSGTCNAGELCFDELPPRGDSSATSSPAAELDGLSLSLVSSRSGSRLATHLRATTACLRCLGVAVGVKSAWKACWSWSCWGNDGAG
mmetsp:Transcript_101082/g.286480  ORF Transcript_101082/g.286480 Transcript_101082/m.286480 type:complete len:233 (-) Transcript_101082:385-1083(-)